LGNRYTWIDEMKYKTQIFSALTLLLFSTSGWTQDGDAAEATIRLMGVAEAEASEDVTREITLPQHLMDAEDADEVAAVSKAEKGLATATENVNKEHSNNASSQAQEARERGAEMSENAKENRENRGRSDPPGRPDNPGPPDNPGRP
jgi:hypothetical protein